MKQMLITFLATLVAAPFARAAGETACWTNTASGSYDWFTAANWTNETGVLDAAPSSGEDVVLASSPAVTGGGFGSVISDLDDWKVQILYTKGSDNSTTFATSEERLAAHPNVTVGKITGDLNRTIIIDDREGKGDYDLKNVAKIPAPDGGYGRYFKVSDPNDFYGLWNPRGVYSRLIVSNDTTKTAVIHNMTAANIPVLSVAKNVSAEVELVMGGGAIRKCGAGKATFGQADLKQTKIVVEEGEIELAGHAEDALANLLAKSAIHLDATKDLFEKASDGNGHELVYKWYDAEGRAGLYAFANTNRNPAAHEAHVIPPYYVANATANGLPLVDLSAYKNPGASHSAQILELSKRFANVREVFYVADCPATYGASDCWMLGDCPPSGSSLQFCPGGGGVLYGSTYSDPCVRYGDIFLNGVVTAYNACGTSALTALHTLAQSTLQDACVKLLGSREYYGSSSGGSRFGEVILFTNALTRAERVYLSNYLNAKWGTAADLNGGRDFDEVFVSDSFAGATTIRVPAGRVAKIGTLRLKNYGSAYGLVKEGAGTLEVDEVYPASAKIFVNDGKVVFRRANVRDDAPVDGAYVWLDASKITAADVTVQGGTNYVVQWNDCRGEATYARAAHTDGMHMPRLVYSPIVGTNVLDFGVVNGDATVRDNTSAAMHLSNWGNDSKRAYCYFAVMRMKTIQNASVPILAGSDMATYRDSAAFFSSNYRTARSLASSVSVNGEAIDPTGTPTALYYTGTGGVDTTNQFYVVAVSAAAPFRMDGLCCQRNGCDRTCGGMEFAEVLTYLNPLTPDEQRQTVAYLMKKWLGKKHPCQTETPRLNYEKTDDVTFDADADLAIWDEVKGGNGHIVKTGTGTVSVVTLQVAPTTIAVEAGVLSVPISQSTFFDNAAFHFDASRLDTMDYTVDAGVTNVSTWADVRGNGVTAEADSDELATQKPRLATVEMAPGVTRPVMDFGAYSWRTNDWYEKNGSASMQVKKDGSVFRNNIEEAFLVFADAEGDHRASLFSAVGGHPTQRDWTTGKLGVWRYEVAPGVYCSAIGADSSQFLNATAPTLDDVQTWGPHVIPSAGFHIFDYVNSNDGRNAVNGWAGFEVSAFARSDGSVKANGNNWPFDYDFAWSDRGGIRIAEQLIFTTIQKEADATYVKNLLKYKWFGGPHPGCLATNELDSVSVAQGSTLTFNVPVPEALLASVREVNGTGKIKTMNLSLTEAIDVTLANGSADCLTVDGTVSLDEALAVNVTVDTARGKLRAGLYPILTATTLTMPDNAAFTINVLTSKSGIIPDKATVVRDGNMLYLKVEKRGLLLMVR